MQATDAAVLRELVNRQDDLIRTLFTKLEEMDEKREAGRIDIIEMKHALDKNNQETTEVLVKVRALADFQSTLETCGLSVTRAKDLHDDLHWLHAQRKLHEDKITTVRRVAVGTLVGAAITAAIAYGKTVWALVVRIFTSSS